MGVTKNFHQGGSIPRSVAIILVNSLVFPKLDYCSAALYGLTDGLNTRLQSVVNASARLVERLPFYAHVPPSLENLQWPPVRSRIEMKLVTLIFKCLHGLAPNYLCEMFRLASCVPGRTRLRSAATNSLVIPRLRLKSVSKRLFCASGSRAWNSLPSSLTTPDSLKTLKLASKDFYLK